MVQWNWPVRASAIALTSLFIVTASVILTDDVMAQATPTAAAVDIPAPQDCQVEPRSYPFFAESSGRSEPATPAPLDTEPAEPFEIPTGEAPDEETAAAVTATLRESLACRNANDFLRAYALFTDDMLVALFGGPATVDPDIRALIGDEALKPVSPRQRIALTAVADMVVLPDGRVGAAVETLNANQTFRDFVIFEQDAESGRWLIDETRVITHVVP